MSYNMKPFLKWVGGKRQLSDRIKERMPKHYNRYLEPFLGGGALLFDLQPEVAFVNDLNKELLESYTVIKEEPYKLMELLDIHQSNHLENAEEYFYTVRGMDRENNYKDLPAVVRSARLIYLNKTCFNGMYRVNKKGYFNSPWNKETNVNLYDRENILEISRYLNENSISIDNKDFNYILNIAKPGDFIFLDPPYDSLTTETFRGYTKEGFTERDQIRLAILAHRLKARGCYVMLTNHSTNLILDLYSDEFNIDTVKVKRLINSDPSNRRGEEVIIYSYDIEGDKQ